MTDSPDLDATAAALRVLARRLDRRLRAEAGFADYSPSQLAAMRHLREAGEAGLTSSELARLEGVRPQSMSATVADLVEAGLVDRTADPNDRRATRLSPSAQADAIAETARGAKDTWLASALAERLDADEQRRLADAVELLERVLGP
ncbi:MarR family transcriptional regulator [Agromyces protaetiae]|uniref:MarR family transcriptional regulator n=1 Tax=Agromyces protaetiae TaxID=2509455 RepID=A0A4P6FEQ0_9MICO|nr:MarR family transcriptional regulator [Agromyces protaetiae]QAY72839.1 MarR family transcriptional regulator [Agromyces protaetiae]